MVRWLILLASMALTGCSGLSWNTEVAATQAARTAMALSVIPGETTERSFATRWGNPTQKVREGGQTEFVYRDIRNPKGWYFPQFGDSHHYVVVTFQYGLAAGVRTSDGIDCRGTFPPRPTGFPVDNPSTVRLVGTCAPTLTAAESSRKGPIARSLDTLNATWQEARSDLTELTGTGSGTTGTPASEGSGLEPNRPGVIDDDYSTGGKVK